VPPLHTHHITLETKGADSAGGARAESKRIKSYSSNTNSSTRNTWLDVDGVRRRALGGPDSAKYFAPGSFQLPQQTSARHLGPGTGSEDHFTGVLVSPEWRSGDNPSHPRCDGWEGGRVTKTDSRAIMIGVVVVVVVVVKADKFRKALWTSSNSREVVVVVVVVKWSSGWTAQ